MRHQDITEVSDPHLLTIDAPVPDVPEIRVLKGEPTDAELAAVVTVLAGLRGGGAALCHQRRRRDYPPRRWPDR